MSCGASLILFCRLVEADEPKEWFDHKHPKGNVYYSATRADFKIITEANIKDETMSKLVNAWIKYAQGVMKKRSIELAATMELFLRPSDATSCEYYVVDHAKQVIFWFDDVNTEDIVTGTYVETKQHLRKQVSCVLDNFSDLLLQGFALTSEYWQHLYLFPAHHTRTSGVQTRVGGLKEKLLYYELGQTQKFIEFPSLAHASF